MVAQQITDLTRAGNRELALMDRYVSTIRDHLLLSQAYNGLAQQYARLAAAYNQQNFQLQQVPFSLQHPSNVARARAERYAMVVGDGVGIAATSRLVDSDGGLAWRAPPPTGFIEEEEVESENENDGERTL